MPKTRTVKVTRKYQVTIPRDVREKLGIRVGDRILVEIEGNKIVLRPLVVRKKDPIEEMLNLLDKPLDIDAVRLVEESWNES